MGPIWAKWGGNIERELGRLGKSQSWLARELNVDRATVNRWVRGNSGPSDEFKLDISRVLGVAPMTLFPLEEEQR